MRRFGAALLLGGVAAGLVACAGPAFQAAAPAMGGAQAKGSLRVRDASPARRLQAEASPAPGISLVPFTKSRLSRVEVFLDDLGAEVGPQRSHDLSPSQFNNALVFDNLVEGGSYRITLKAWQPANLSLPLGNQLEAQADEGSSLSFAVPLLTPLVDLDPLGGLVLTLKDRDSASQGAGGIQLQPGVIQNPAASEALVP